MWLKNNKCLINRHIEKDMVIGKIADKTLHVDMEGGSVTETVWVSRQPDGSLFCQTCI